MTFLSGLAERVSVVVIGTYVLAMAMTILLLIVTPIGQQLFDHEGHIVLGAFLIPFYTPLSINLLASFLVLLAIFTLCFLSAAKSKGGLLTGLRRFFTASDGKNLPNWLLIMPLVSSALVLIIVVLTFLQDTAGIPTGSLPQLDDYQLLYTLAYAPPVEEFMFRISTLGLLVALRTVWATPTFQTFDNQGLPVTHSLSRTVGLSFLSPDSAKREAGLPCFKESGWKSIHWTEWTLLLITSVGFGLAHVLTGVGWEIGKVAPAAISGLALGLSYMLYGAYADILLHWFFNVYFEAYALGSSLIGGAFIAVEGVVGLLTYVAGAVGVVSAIIWLLSLRKQPGESPYTIPSNNPIVSGEGALYHRQVD